MFEEEHGISARKAGRPKKIKIPMSATKKAQWDRVLSIAHAKKRKGITDAGRRGAKLMKYMGSKGKALKTVGALATGAILAYGVNKLVGLRKQKKGMLLRKTGQFETESNAQV